MEIIIGITILVFLFVVIKKKSLSTDLPEKVQTYDNMQKSICITLNAERQKQERQKYHEIAEQTISDMIASGYFKSDCMPALAEKIHSITLPGYRYSDPFDNKDCLTLSEKKELGLNTQRKYSRELINTLSEKGLTKENPNDLVKNIWLANFHKISRKYRLQELKEAGFKYVKIIHCNDERDCKAVKLCKKRWAIDEVPELPLPDCTSEYCRCSYSSDVEDFSKDIDLSKLYKK